MRPAEFLGDTCNIILQARRALKISSFLVSQNYLDTNLVAFLKMNVDRLHELTERLDQMMETASNPVLALEALATERDNCKILSEFWILIGVLGFYLIGKYCNFETNVEKMTKSLVELCNDVISKIEECMITF